LGRERSGGVRSDGGGRRHGGAEHPRCPGRSRAFLAARHTGLGSAGPSFRGCGDARRRADGLRYDAFPPDAIDRIPQAGHHPEVDEAGGSREEGRRHQEAEDGAGPQGREPQEDHRPEVGHPEDHRPQVDQARGSREEGRGDPEAEDGAGPQGGGEEVDGPQVDEARGSREEGRRDEEAEDGPSSQGGDEEVDGPQVDQARGGGEEGSGNPEAEDHGGTQGTFTQLALTEAQPAPARPVASPP
jgi:hypothetical protein